jgi:prepilin-type N-terminal cleavage/methylation domain-containing protein
MKTDAFKKQRGYTMVELTIGVTVVALVLAGVISAGRRLSQDVAFNQLLTEVEGGLQTLKSLSKRQPNTNFVNNDWVSITRAFPTLSASGINLQYPPLGLDFRFYSSGEVANAAGNQLIQMNIYSFDQGMCINLLTALAPSAYKVSVYVGGQPTVVKPAGNNTFLDAALATQRCSQGAWVIESMHSRI